MIRAHLNLVFFHAISPEEFKELIKSIQPQDSQAKDFPKSQDWPKAYFHDDSKIVYNC